MRVRLSWLRDYVSVAEDLDTLVDILTYLGLGVEDIEPWGTDHVLDLEVTVNRPDCLSHLGVARELAAWLGRPVQDRLHRPEESTEEATSSGVRITIEATDGCLRYIARIVMGVRVGESPDWMKDRLESVGIHPVNNLVDITNYVMLAYGQPLHAFDLDRLRGREIIVRRARPGESICALDDVTYSLDESVLVIADRDRPIAIAGVIGGVDASIHPDTRNVLIESAYFVPRAVRRSRRQLGVQTESSYRFERGVDPGMVDRAADHAAHLMQVIAGGTVLAGRLDVNYWKDTRTTIRLRWKRIQHVLGHTVDPEWVERRLNALGFSVMRRPETDTPVWDVTPPTFRGDVREEMDLIEEVARHVGYESVPLTLPPVTHRVQADYPGFHLERLARSVLQGLGLMETVSTSFYPESVREVFHVTDPVQLANPLSDRRTDLRRWIAMGLIEAVQWNHRHGNIHVRLWEIGQVFMPAEEGPREARHLGMACSGDIPGMPDWSRKSRPVDFYDIKGLVATFFVQMGWPVPEFHPSAFPFLHPHQQAEIRCNDTPVGWIGRFHPKWTEVYELRAPVFLAEIDWSRLITLTLPWPEFRPWSPLPVIVRDIAVLVRKDVPFHAMAQAMAALQVEELTDWQLVDRYGGPQIPADMWSYTLRLIFAPTAHRSAEEIEQRVARVVAHLERTVGARLRTESTTG